MRKTNVPPVCRACAQLNSAVRISPTCTIPVGDGQNRVRTATHRAPPAVETASAAATVLDSVPRPSIEHSTR